MKGLNIINVAPLVILLAVSLVSEVESIGCYSCWSNETAECATGPIIRVGLTDCAESDTCLTAIVDGLTFRGCSSSVSLAPNYPLKESCTIEYCNSRIYPADRLICYKCEGDQCIQPSGNSRPCVNYSENDQCFTDVISETNTIRGCVSDGNNTATQYTRTCSSNLCNNDRSYKPLECLNCASNETLDCVRPVDAGENCQISIQTTCTMSVLLGRQEFCYTYQSGDYVERGCSADSTIKSVEYETRCYEGKCNGECIPQSVCYVCDSLTDPNCGTNLTELTPEACSSQGASSCYTCLAEDSEIYRGCGTSANLNTTQGCVTCTNSTAGCNDYMFDTTPPVTFDCYQCNGTADCLLLNDNSKYLLPCSNPYDSCVQIMSNSKMYRGCMSSPVGEVCQDQRELCYVCDTPGCNDRPLVMPSNLTCIQCFSLECDWGMQSSASSPCSKVYYFQNESCYTYQSPDGLVDRGCAADLKCISNGWDCTYCSTDDCNNQNLIWQNCIQCNSKDDGKCETGNGLNSTRCPGEIITYEQRGCYVRREVNGLTYRGCSSSIPFDNSLRTTCSKNYCNDDPFPENRLVCYKCKGTECNSPSGNSRPCLNYIQNDTCYIDVINATETRRGCMSDGNFTATENTMTCNTSYCNHNPSDGIYGTTILPDREPSTNDTSMEIDKNVKSNKCFVCSSTNDTNCIMKNSSRNIIMTTTVCEASCITRLNLNNVTERGCSYNISCSKDDLYCKTCDGSFCNDISTETIKCYQCNGERPCLQLKETDQPRLCPIDGSKKCFQYINSDEIMIRGCMPKNITKKCSDAGKKCLVCDKDGCNGIPLLRNSTLSCIQCKNSENCPWAFDASNGRRCDALISYYQNDSCYTGSITVARTVVARGCTSDGKYQANSTYFDACSGNNCNTANHAWQDCLQCSSQNSMQCLNGTYEPARCPGKRITYEERGCYTMKEDGTVKRGCGIGDEAGSCVFCNNADGCNNRTLTHCYNCSSADDRHCTDPLSSEGVATTLCDSSCIEKIVGDHYIVRDCESPSLTCEGSDSAYCNTCDEDLCNNVVKPLGALECYHCGIDNPCDEVGEAGTKPERCTYYEPADRCVQYYNSTMIRGCLSDSIGGSCLDLGHECLSCDTAGCNGLPLYKSPSLSCIQCSGSDKCAWGFQNSAGSVCKKDVLFWQQESCYTVQYNATEAKRGCVLDEDACNNCKECSTTNCNRENIIKQSCIQCSINDDPSCATVNAQDASECTAPIQIYENRGCYVLNKVDEQTYRGCSSDLELSEDYPLQLTCDEEYCNRDIFPSNRLTCYKCEGRSCISAFGGTRPCVNYDENDLCYTNVFTESNVTRGCLSDGNITDTTYVVTCGTNNCNNPQPMRTLSCIKCSSDESRDCVRDPQQAGESCTISVEDTCTVFPLLGREDGCYVKREGDLVQRGCLSVDFGPENPGENEENFETCQTNICNRNCQPERKCYTCSSSADPRCASNVNQLQPQVCDDYGLSTCYACMSEDGMVTRGCGSNNLTDLCLSCDANGCNQFELKYCYVCSSESDPNCAQLTNPQAFDSKICYSDCIAKVDGQNTVRGCATDFEACAPNDPNCQTCAGNLCNTEIVPAKRLQCYHCDGSTPCLNLTSKNELSLPCVNYDPNEKCMAYLSKNTLIRGCLSDKAPNDCIEAGIKCLTCDTSNCNGVPLLRPSELTCISCYYLTECSWGFEPTTGRKCQGDVPFYANESCFTLQYEDGSISRGCSLEGGCDSNNPNCQTCDSNNCNNANVVYQNCIQCESSTSTDCEKESDGSSASRCPADIQTYQDRGCYVQRKDDKVIRGCLAELSLAERNYCKDEENEDCEFCLEQACNKQVAPNKSSYLQSTSLVVALSLLFIFLHVLKK